MSHQIPEKLMWDGKTVYLDTCPLETYFTIRTPRPIFKIAGTSMLRGYLALWEIEGGALFMTGIDAIYQSGVPLTLGKLFPGPRDRDTKYANWYSGALRGYYYHQCTEEQSRRYRFKVEFQILNGFIDDITLNKGL
jgi:hypothetical protein